MKFKLELGLTCVRKQTSEKAASCGKHMGWQGVSFTAQLFRQKARMNRWLFSSWVCPVATLKLLSQKNRMWERHSVASFLLGCPGHIKRLGQSMWERFLDERLELLSDAGLNARGLSV